MLRSKICIFGIDSKKINWSISGTAQENLIIILIVAGMWTLPEEDLGRLDRHRKVVYSGAWNMHQARKKSMTFLMKLMKMTYGHWIKSAQINNVEIAKGVNSWEDAIKSLDLKVENKIKVILPIIPLLLTYEGSYNFESSIRLDDAWNKLKALDWQ